MLCYNKHQNLWLQIVEFDLVSFSNHNYKTYSLLFTKIPRPIQRVLKCHTEKYCASCYFYLLSPLFVYMWYNFIDFWVKGPLCHHIPNPNFIKHYLKGVHQMEGFSCWESFCFPIFVGYLLQVMVERCGDGSSRCHPWSDWGFQEGHQPQEDEPWCRSLPWWPGTFSVSLVWNLR